MPLLRRLSVSLLSLLASPDCWDNEWLLETFPQLQTYPRVDFVRGPEKDEKGQSAPARGPMREVEQPNITHYFAPMPVRLSEKRARRADGCA